MTLIQILTILLIHWIADFILQTDYQAKNKSVSNLVLSMHCITYTMCTTILWFIMIRELTITDVISVILPIFFLHWATDWGTSRIVRVLFAKQDYHWGFVVIGFDQLLHFAQLFYLFELIK
jgi:hypothetical protein